MKIIINHLRSFSNLDQPEDLSVFNVNELLQNAPIMFSERMQLAKVNFELDKKDEQLLVEANKMQLARVFQILVLNSIEAYERYPTISDRSITITSQFDAKKNKQILISFVDHAGGIPEHLKFKIFDPFTSSKDEVTGVGFGLSIAWSVVVGIGGEIDIEEVDGGANFLIRLPVHEGKIIESNSSTQNRALKQANEAVKISPEIKPLVLIVDDESEICDLLKCYLEEFYEVHHTSSANSALKMASQQSFDLVISDFKMPEMDGILLINKIVEQSPNTKFILISGHLVSIDTLGFSGGKQNLGFISKPFGDPTSILDYIKEFMY